MANLLGIVSELGTDNVPKYPSRHNAREKKLAETLINDKNIDDDFEQALICSASNNADGTVYTGASDEQLGFLSGKAAYEMHLEAGTTAETYPFTDADGLRVTSQAGGTGVTDWEITNGNTARSRAAYTIGSLPGGDPIMFECNMDIATVARATRAGIGFRKVEAYNSLLNYTDFAVIEKDGDENIDIVSDLNNSGSPTTSDTGLDWSDGEDYTLRVEVSNDGSCKFFVDDTEYDHDFTFDDGDTIIPFMYADTETGDPDISLATWRVGKK